MTFFNSSSTILPNVYRISGRTAVRPFGDITEYAFPILRTDRDEIEAIFKNCLTGSVAVGREDFVRRIGEALGGMARRAVSARRMPAGNRVRLEALITPISVFKMQL